MTRLYLMRHGETVDNARQMMQGQSQGQLNATGVAQAEEARDRMAGVRFDAIVASDLRRSIETAEIMALPHSITVTTTPLLRERDWGDFTGRFIPDLKGEPWPPNVESMEHMMARAAEFLDFIRQHWPSSQVLAVGHGIMNKAIQAVLLNTQTRHIERMANAEVRVFEI